LVEIAGAIGIEEQLGLPPDFRLGNFAARQALNNSFDVAINYSHGFFEGDAGDGGGGVSPDAGKIAEGGRGLRENAAVPFNNFPSALVEHARPAVVAETTPGGENGIKRRGGERCDAGKALEEEAVVFENGGDARLLEHDFGKPDAVRVAGFTPGEIAAVFVIPAQESAAESGCCWRGGSIL
jgi:hypothetical protein